MAGVSAAGDACTFRGAVRHDRFGGGQKAGGMVASRSRLVV